MDESFYKLKSYTNRLNVLDLVYKTKKGHLGGTFSCLDILTVLYYSFLDINSANFELKNRNRLIVGKGHACLGIYNILIDLNILNENILDEYGEDGSYLGAQLEIKIPGVETNTGSLGHAVGISAGIALAAKLDSMNLKTVALIGDGECDEGSIWESAMFAGEMKLNNLIVIVDRNWQSVTELKNKQNVITSLEDKFQSCGWDVTTIDGHNYQEILKSLNLKSKPLAIIADTIKGKGVDFMESGVKWHSSVPNESEYLEARKQLLEVLANVK